MIVNNGERVALDIPGVFSGIGGRQGGPIWFPAPSATPIRGQYAGSVDGITCRLLIQPAPDFSRRTGGLLLATILS